MKKTYGLKMTYGGFIRINNLPDTLETYEQYLMKHNFGGYTAAWIKMMAKYTFNKRFINSI